MLIDLYTASVIIFVLVVIVFLIKDRKKITRDSVVFYRRTQRARAFLTNLGLRHPRLWAWVGNAGIITGFIGSFVMIVTLVLLAVLNILRPQAQAGVALVLPVPGTNAIIGTGFVGAPFWYWMISIALLLVVHEGFHGIMAAREKIPIKSLGLVLIAILPGAFVEPDEKVMKKKPLMGRLRVFAAGSFANFLLGGISAALLVVLSGILFVPLFGAVLADSAGGALYDVSPPDGILVTLTAGLPAQLANFSGKIVAVNGMPVATYDDFSRSLANVSAGDSATFTTMDGRQSKSFTLTAVSKDPSDPKGYFGFSSAYSPPEYTLKQEYSQLAPVIGFVVGTYPFTDMHSGGLLFWILLINFGVGLFNLLPIKILDGGLMWHGVIEKLTKVHAGRIMNAISAILVLIILVNFAGAFGVL